MAVSLEFLKSIPYFSGLGIAQLELIRKVVFEKSLDRTEMVEPEGEPAESLYFVASGVVKLFRISTKRGGNQAGSSSHNNHEQRSAPEDNGGAFMRQKSQTGHGHALVK
jgi:CRP-like cAMP-binding protein